MDLWYLSFCDPEKPEGSQFLGACIVRSASLEGAVRAAWRAGVNPGGEVLGGPVPKDVVVPPEHTYVLLSKAELERAFGPLRRVG